MSKTKGILENEWRAKWITHPYKDFGDSRNMPAPYFRKSFQAGQKVKSAKVRICGLGYFELYLNGKKVGDEVLNPPFTKYDATVLYCTYDVTAMLKTGENVLGVILGNGMYNMYTGKTWNHDTSPWRHHPKLLLKAEFEMDDGTSDAIASDDTWKTATGPIISDNLYEGEIYDARLEIPDWCKPGFDDTAWAKPVVCRGPGGVLKHMDMEPCRVVGTVEPYFFNEIEPGVWLCDLGKNISGWVRLKVKGREGTQVTLRFAEKLAENGDLDPSNINVFTDKDKFQTDVYIMKGDAEETWEPRFVYHGFQYVRIEGFPGTPDKNSITGCIVNTDLKKRGSFQCSNDLLNRIQSAALASTLGNYHGMPTDCPHREKNGWTGDALISAEQVLLNLDPLKAYKKWMRDFMDCQRPNGQLPGIVPTGGWGFNWGSGPAWDSAFILIPWYMYLYDGDTSILPEIYDAAVRYVDFMTSMSSDFLVDFGLGDWCPPQGVDNYKCPSVVTDTAFYYIDALTLSRFAGILGHKSDRKKYEQLAEKIRKAFNAKFVNSKTGEVTGNCQTSYSCALYYGLVEGEVKNKITGNLVKEVERCDRHIDCGILGAKYTMQVLNDIGRPDLAYAIATQTTFPGWGNWIELGATTLWETWGGNNSRNHHMFSDISAWFYRCLAGINPDPEDPGFRHIILKPAPVEGLEWVKCSHECSFGLIECNWGIEDGKLRIDAVIPEGCRATLHLPEKYLNCAVVNAKGDLSIM